MNRERTPRRQGLETRCTRAFPKRIMQVATVNAGKCKWIPIMGRASLVSGEHAPARVPSLPLGRFLPTAPGISLRRSRLAHGRMGMDVWVSAARSGCYLQRYLYVACVGGTAPRRAYKRPAFPRLPPPLAAALMNADWSAL